MSHSGPLRLPSKQDMIVSSNLTICSIFGLSVQLEWTPACHVGDHGFESRTDRNKRGTTCVEASSAAALLRSILSFRLMAGQQILILLVLVRIQQGQLI